jgi:hypothetical protein
VLCVAAVWRWRTRRTVGLAACAAITAGLAAWLHSIAGIYAAIACLFVFFEDVLTGGDKRPRPSWSSLALGAAVAGAMAALLAAPLINDHESLSGKAGGDQPTFETYERMLAIFWGGVPTPVVVAGVPPRRVGRGGALPARPAAGHVPRAPRRYPAVGLTISGGLWMHSGQNFGRYQLPLQPLLLFFGSLGAMDAVRAIARARADTAAWIASGVLSAAYLAATPTLMQVATLGPWYAHLDYHWDYRQRWNVARRGHPEYAPPEFYGKLARMAPGSAPVIEAPFTHEAPHNNLAVYATYHRQPEIFGMIHDLCLDGVRTGEPARDRRFRFRRFVFLDDVQAVRNTGARFLLLHLERIHGRPFREAPKCLEKLTQLYGEPVDIDARLAVFDLKPAAKK